MTEVKEFTPILVSRNVVEINRLQKQLYKRADQFNEFFNMAAQFLDGQELDLQQLAEKQMQYVDGLFPRQFPKGTLAINLEASGVQDDYNHLKSIAAKCGSFGGLSIQAGKAKPTKIAIRAIIDANEKYTTSERQNEVIEKAQRLSEVLNEVIEARMIPQHAAPQLVGETMFLDWNGKGFEPSLTGIARFF